MLSMSQNESSSLRNLQRPQRRSGSRPTSMKCPSQTFSPITGSVRMWAFIEFTLLILFVEITFVFDLFVSI